MPAAMQALHHRGPDGEGLFAGEGALLGMRRLAIIDVEGGDQPIYNEDASLICVCNGEIYNAPELMAELGGRGHRFQSRSDVNVIPHLYEERGSACVEALRGMFAFAVWDSRARRLTLGRDRVGKKPLFFAHHDGALLFASELPALRRLMGRTPELDPAGLRAFLRYGFVPAPLTIFTGIHALPGGSVLTWQEGAPPVVTRYWDRQVVPQPLDRPDDEVLEELDAAILDAVRLRLRSDVPVGLFLSGGIDSGLMASYAAQAGARDLLCFVASVDDPDLDERDLALHTARALGHPTLVVDIEPRNLVETVLALAPLFGQPFADSSAIPTLLLARRAAEHRKVVLNGDGGDEVFGGYRRYIVPSVASRALASTAITQGAAGLVAAVGSRATARRRSPLGFAGRAMRGLAHDGLERYLVLTSDGLPDGLLDDAFPDLADIALPGLENDAAVFASRGRHARELMWTDTRHLLHNDLLVKMDMATMASGIEARSPLLDTELMALTWSLPDHWFRITRETKPLLRRLAERRLPDAVAKAPKRGFEIPLGRWLDGPLRELVEDTVLADDGRVAALGDADIVRRLATGTHASFRGGVDGVRWKLLMLELFLRDIEDAGTAAAPLAR